MQAERRMVYSLETYDLQATVYFEKFKAYVKEETMKLGAKAWLLMIFLSSWVFVPSLWAAVEIPDPKLCDAESAEVRQGRPGGAEVRTVDGVGPMKKMTRAEEAWSSAAKASGKIPAPDKRHLCLALNPIKNPENRFKHKDHSTYYCTLILNRDIQAYCYAVVDKNSKKCDLIVSKELEKECLKKSDKNYIAEETKKQARAPVKKTTTEKSAKKKDAPDPKMKELQDKMDLMERQRKELLEKINAIKKEKKGQ